MNEENKVTPGSPSPVPSSNPVPPTPAPKPTPPPQAAQKPPVNTSAQNEINRFLPQEKPKSTLAEEVPQIPQVKLDPHLVQKPIRTFESDLAEALAKKQGGSAAISIAEAQRKEEELRRMREEKAQAVQQGAPQRPIVRPIAPTAATAIPGATISIPPKVERDPNQVSDEIAAALQANRPVPPPKPAAMPTNAEPVTPLPPIPPKPISVPRTAAINVPQTTEPRRSILKPLIMTVLSLGLIGGGVYAAYIIYSKNLIPKTDTPVAVQTPIVVPNIIPHDKEVSVPVGNLAGDNLITKIYSEANKSSVEQGKITNITVGSLTSSQFINKLNTHIPDVITRSLTDRYSLGLYGEETGQKTTFLALTTDFFQNAFAGMLIWEDNNLADDLALLLNYKERARTQDLNGTSTIQDYFSIRGTYSDRVLRNRDVREFRNPKGELLFLYSFINKETLIITTTESTFIALVDRIEKDAYVR